MINPSESQMRTFLATDQSSPVIFINCHRYYADARYPDGFSDERYPVKVSGREANQVADKMSQQGISVEVIDPRTTSPLDEDSILDSVEKTGRLVVVDESNPFCSMASEIASLAVCEAYDYLKAPVVKVTVPHTPVPATPALEQAYIPSTAQIETAVHTVLDFDSPRTATGLFRIHLIGRVLKHMLIRKTTGMCFCFLLGTAHGAESADPYGGWAYYGGTQDGIRYSSQDQITAGNVTDLEVAWTYHSGEMERRGPDLITNSSTQNTPTLVAGSLMICTPFNRLIALDPATGKERWVFDAEIDLSHKLPYQYNCRGVTGWENQDANPESDCKHRVFMGTNDVRLFAIDAKTGKRCKDFGSNGEISVTQQRPHQFAGERKLVSAPVVINGIVAVGSFVMDNLRTDAPLGTVFAFDALSGKELWSFDPIPRDASDPARASWHDDSALTTGAANVWSTMVADPERDLIFAPVGSASPDFWGGERKGDNLYSSSIVALSAKTGEVIWHFQHVHHDIWDYDTPSPPVLIDIEHDGRQVPAVVQNTKQGFVFVLNRETGEPVFGVEEHPVPQNALAGEWLSPTQPFPVSPPPLVPQHLRPEDAWGFTYFDRKACRERISSLRSEGIFTPPSTAPGSIIYPGTAGGMNWGGPAFDPKRKWMIVNTTNVPQVVILVPRKEIEGIKGINLEAGNDVAAALGTPYGVRREWLLSPLGAPCVKPPWGELLAVDLENGNIEWRVPLGSIEKMLPLPIEWNLGTPNLGGPIVTAGGLIFIAATMDGYLRAFNIETGEELWKDELPGGTQTTPMTYTAGGKQYLVMVSGHHLWFGSPASDAVVAYSLPGQSGTLVRN